MSNSGKRNQLTVRESVKLHSWLKSNQKRLERERYTKADTIAEAANELGFPVTMPNLNKYVMSHDEEDPLVPIRFAITRKKSKSNMRVSDVQEDMSVLISEMQNLQRELDLDSSPEFKTLAEKYESEIANQSS